MEATIEKPRTSFFKIKNEEEILTYELLQQYKKEQNRLIACGTIKRPQRIIRDFTPEEQAEFDRGLTIEQIFADLEEKYVVAV